jgi:hypothetical protein
MILYIELEVWVVWTFSKIAIELRRHRILQDLLKLCHLDLFML